MSLLTRLVQPAVVELKLPVHQFMAGCSEYRRGAPGVTIQVLATAFGLSASEQTALINFLAQAGWTSNPPTLTRELVHDVLMLGEDGYYTVAQCQNRLGL